MKIWTSMHSFLYTISFMSGSLILLVFSPQLTTYIYFCSFSHHVPLSIYYQLKLIPAWKRTIDHHLSEISSTSPNMKLLQCFSIKVNNIDYGMSEWSYPVGLYGCNYLFMKHGGIYIWWGLLIVVEGCHIARQSWINIVVRTDFCWQKILPTKMLSSHQLYYDNVSMPMLLFSYYLSRKILLMK